MTCFRAIRLRVLSVSKSQSIVREISQSDSPWTRRVGHKARSAVGAWQCPVALAPLENLPASYKRPSDATSPFSNITHTRVSSILPAGPLPICRVTVLLRE